MAPLQSETKAAISYTHGMQPGTPSTVIKWDHTEKRKSFITQHALRKDRALTIEEIYFF